MPNPALRIVVPVIIGAAASAGAIVGTMLLQDRRSQLSLGTPRAPLAFEGWWSSGESSPMAYAHPAVLFIDTATGTVVDSWDRRTRARVPAPQARWSAEWPADAVIVVDAVSGDLLQTLRTASATGEGMARG